MNKCKTCGALTKGKFCCQDHYESMDKAFLYIVEIESKIKIGITHNIYKRMNELYRINCYDDFKIHRVINSDTKFICTLECIFKSMYEETNEYYDLELKSRLLNAIDNLNCWISMNNLDTKYELPSEFTLSIMEPCNYLTMHNDFVKRTGSQPTYQYFISNKLSDSDYVYDKVVNLVISKVDTHRLFELSSGQITHNCRLQLDKRELLKKGGGLFGAAEQTGSTGVVTINLPQLGYLYKGDVARFYEELRRLLDLAKESLVVKRKLIQELTNQGFYPYSKAYVNTLNTYFNTIGINGMNECIRNFTNDTENITTEYGVNFTNTVLDYINSVISDYQVETDLLFNLEASPAEGVSYRLALHDKKKWSDIITAGTEEAPYYTNSTWLPVDYTDDIFEALDIQDQFQTKYTGGTVFHAYLGEAVNAQATAKLVKTIFNTYRLPYLTISPVYSVCPVHGYLSGEHQFCPKCADEELVKVENRMRELEGSN